MLMLRVPQSQSCSSSCSTSGGREAGLGFVVACSQKWASRLPQTRAHMHSLTTRIIESFRLEKTLYIIKSNHQSSPADQLLAILELLTSIPQASHGEILGVLQGRAAPSLQG